MVKLVSCKNVFVDTNSTTSIEEVNRSNNSNKNNDLESLSLNDILDLLRSLLSLILAEKQQKSKSKLLQKPAHFLSKKERIGCVKEISQELL